MSAHVIAHTDELGPGDRIVTEVEGREVAVFNLDGEYRAYLNWCLHQGGPVCEGTITGTIEASYDREAGETSLTWTRDGEVLMCPWHGWEYDVTTGECLSRRTHQLPSYPVSIRDDQIVIEL